MLAYSVEASRSRPNATAEYIFFSDERVDSPKTPGAPYHPKGKGCRSGHNRDPAGYVVILIAGMGWWPNVTPISTRRVVKDSEPEGNDQEARRQKIEDGAAALNRLHYAFSSVSRASFSFFARNL